MTYVSRRTRIIISRYPDECDPDQVLRACRKRSDGRLKRYSSCHDFRAWINDNCVKHEYFVDLMSEGEFAGRPSFKLYGRFIPVPILFKLMQTSNVFDDRKNVRSATSTETYTKELSSDGWLKSGTENADSESCSNLSEVQWEKNLLERSLFECTCLLNKAINQLEKIDSIVSFAIEGSDWEPSKKCDEYADFRQSRSCSVLSDPEKVRSAKSSMRKLKHSVRYTQLLRKVSGLREKLKKINECRRVIQDEIRLSMRRAKCSATLPITDSLREQEYVKKLQKKMERLIAKKGKLLNKMYAALTSLNNLKRLSQCVVDRNEKDNRGICDNEKLVEPLNCTCGMCHGNDAESQKSFDSCATDTNENVFSTPCQMEGSLECQTQYECLDYKNIDSGIRPSSLYSKSEKPSEEISKYEDCKTPSGFSKSSACNNISLENESSRKDNDGGVPEKRDATSEKKSKVTMDESQCQKKYYADDVSFYENSLSPEQEKIVLGILRNIQPPRPSTSPTTRKERRAANFGMNAERQNPHSDGLPNVSERRVKSETTMKEIEKTLRNYERRLNCLDCLEDKIENLREKVAEGQELKEQMEKMKVEEKKRSTDREKSVREINRLWSENWALKQQVEELTVKCTAQSKKMQGLKCGMMKARELECQAEEMKKKLSEYRDSIEHQRKCISNWENVVAMQNAEIQNLMNHIKKLRMMQEEERNPPMQEKHIQSSRSYSPEMVKGIGPPRPKTQRSPHRQEEEEQSPYCWCSERRHSDSRRKVQRGNSERSHRSLNSRRLEWCV